MSLNRGPSGFEILIDDGVYFNLTPTLGNAYFELSNPTIRPGRIYILRNITGTAYIRTHGSGVLFFTGDSTIKIGVINMATNIEGGSINKTLIFISDGANWTYGQLGF